MKAIRTICRSLRRVAVYNRSCSSLSKKTDAQVKVTEKSVSIQFEDYVYRFHHVWLRHHCPCPSCLHQDTQQRTIDMAMIPAKIFPEKVHVCDDVIHIVWNDGHCSRYDSSWLMTNAYDNKQAMNQLQGFGAIANEEEMMLWDKETITAYPPPEYNYDDITNSDSSSLVSKVIKSLFRYGFLFVNKIPTDEESLAKVCSVIGGHVQETLYGRYYVLENTTLPHNSLAFLSHGLQAHTDISYLTAPPGIQAMHCTCHDGTGGMSLLVDGFKAAKILYEENHDSFKTLANIHIPYEYRSHSHVMKTKSPILELDPVTQELVRVRFSNARVGPFINMNLSFEQMEKLYDAVRVYGSIIRRPENELWYKMTPGRAVVLDNRRVLHGRSFVTGYRKLIGCYAACDDYIAP